MKFDELFNTLMEACYSERYTETERDEIFRRENEKQMNRDRLRKKIEAEKKEKERRKKMEDLSKKFVGEKKGPYDDEDVAKKAKPYDKVTKADFLPKEVQDKINKEK